MRDDLLQDAEGVDGAGVTREGDELQERLVQAAGSRTRANGGPDPPPERTLAPERGGDRDARQP